MNQPAKITVSIMVTALAMISIMIFSGATPAKKRKVYTESEIDELANELKPVKVVSQEEQNALKQVEINKIYALLAQFPIEKFTNGVKSQMLNLSLPELQSIVTIIEKRSKFPRESTWQNSGSDYGQLLQIISKIKP